MMLGGEVIACDLGPYPNISRWMRNMKSLKSWEKVNEAFYQYVVAPNKGKQFVTIEEKYPPNSPFGGLRGKRYCRALLRFNVQPMRFAEVSTVSDGTSRRAARSRTARGR
jgi:hypothetical protein